MLLLSCNWENVACYPDFKMLRCSCKCVYAFLLNVNNKTESIVQNWNIGDTSCNFFCSALRRACPVVVRFCSCASLASRLFKHALFSPVAALRQACPMVVRSFVHAVLWLCAYLSTRFLRQLQCFAERALWPCAPLFMRFFGLALISARAFPICSAWPGVSCGRALLCSCTSLAAYAMHLSALWLIRVFKKVG